jgi:hypothetical protein
VPASVRAQWQAQHTRTALRNTALLHQLRQAIDALDAASIPVVVLKGAALAQTIYENVALRPMRDIDLLVHRQDVPAALRQLAELGYKPADPEVHRGTQLAYENELRLMRADATRTTIDIHWHLLDSPFYQAHPAFARFWQAVTIAPDRSGRSGAGLPVLAPVEQLLHLSAHLVLHHHGEGLLWQHDVAAFARHHADTLDWAAVLTQAQALDLVLPLQQVLSMLVTQWQMAALRPIAEAAAALTPSAAEREVFGRIMAYHGPVAQRFWHDLRSVPTWQARTRYFLRHMFPRPSYIRAQYHLRSAWLVPLYYPVRYYRGAVSVLTVVKQRLYRQR